MDTPNQPQEATQKRGYSYDEAARYLGVSRSTVRELVYSDKLVARKLGAKRLIDRAELDRFFDSLPEVA